MEGCRTSDVGIGEMILVPFEKAPDLIGSMVKRGHVLLSAQKGSLRTDRDALKASDSSTPIFGIQEDDGVMIGVVDYSQNLAHQSIRFHIAFERGTVDDIKKAVRMLQRMAATSGALKINLVVMSDHDSLADSLRELGFAPEVRMRQHSFAGGQLVSISEYGCIL
jgi:hypothetical protein